MRPCIYVTRGWGIHDERWVEALKTVGYEPALVRLGIDVADEAGLPRVVADRFGNSVPTLAGPLDSVTRYLVGNVPSLVGLSWGFDLHNPEDKSWLGGLSGLIVDSDATRAIALDAGVAPSAITFLPWGVDLDVFATEGDNLDLSTWDVPPGAEVVLSLRAHEPIYRIDHIIAGFAQAAPRFPHAHLLIGHQGSLTDTLRKQAMSTAVADRIHFIGSIPEKELPALFRSTDIYISASEVDGTSVTLLQAMACKVPVLVSDTPGNRAWIEHGTTGSTFLTADPRDLASGLASALESPRSSRQRVADAALRRVRADADWKANVQRLKDALDRAAS